MDALLLYVKRTLPDELSDALLDRLADLEQGRFEAILTLPLVKLLLGHQDDERTEQVKLSKYDWQWSDYIFERLGILLSKRQADPIDSMNNPLLLQYQLFFVAIAALQAFIQSNITGPPLSFDTSKILLSQDLYRDEPRLNSIKKDLIKSLGIDGEAAYKLTPHVELLCLADTILICPPIKKHIKGAEWATLRVNFVHQRILSEVSPTLQHSIYDGLDTLDKALVAESNISSFDDLKPQYLLEKAAIHTHHGLDKKARDVLQEAVTARGFQYALTGRLGKRTKFQERDISQLVVLARSKDNDDSNDPSDAVAASETQQASKPQALDLDDDTLLESISFTKQPESSVDVVENTALPPSLASLDPENQPLLHPLDAISLLALASMITNTSPTDGLTREETLPYALRVLDGGSSNWQVYTQALLVRSRIEGYRSRTTERGLLQLQALVDQVIAETTGTTQNTTAQPNDKPSTFLPQASPAESAPAGERLLYVHELCPPTRWELEAELAARWVSLGGLRTALEIYGRLEMWAEEALCWAAVDREDKAKKIVRRQLFHSAGGNDETANLDEEKWEGAPRDPAPSDAPRLYCILGDIDHDISMYEKAWEVSNNRYARAQRSLGRHYFSRRKYVEAAAAYSKALKLNRLNNSSWFALGCALLELSEFERAAEAFVRTVQLDDTDAEAWSNLAAALLKKGTTASTANTDRPVDDETQTPENGEATDPPTTQDPQSHIRDALNALKRAASLRYENHRIWDNLLTVAASLSPPSYPDIVTAITRTVELRGKVEGEKCLDVAILESLVRHVITTEDSGNAVEQMPGEAEKRRGLPRLVVSLFDTHVIPLITTSARLWRLVGTLSLWRRKPGEALAANEKAWRIVTSPSSGWETGTEAQWNEVVQATSDLCDAYESLGAMAREDGQADEIVAKDWRFKARSALRGVMGKAKATWEGTEGWDRLEERLQELKASRVAS